MKLTILGCGTSTGVPLIQCKCEVCLSPHPRNQRLRASAWIEVNDKSFLIDTSTDLRQQALQQKIQRVDAVLYTHPHADHIHGIDELRSFNFIQKDRIPIYGNHWTHTEITKKFSYIFDPAPIEGGGIPLLDFHLINAHADTIDVSGVTVIPIPVSHGSQECVGYRIDSVAYVTDCSYIPPQSLERMKGLSVLVLDCLRKTAHRTHFNLDQALQTIAELRPKRTFLTHLGHEFDYEHEARQLPQGVFFAYDGLTIET